jgi:hypothetical protein
LKKYVEQAGEKAKNTDVGKSVQEYEKMIPGGMEKLQEVAKKRGDEAQKVPAETYKEITDILSEKQKEVKALADKAKKKPPSKYNGIGTMRNSAQSLALYFYNIRWLGLAQSGMISRI